MLSRKFGNHPSHLVKMKIAKRSNQVHHRSEPNTFRQPPENLAHVVVMNVLPPLTELQNPLVLSRLHIRLSGVALTAHGLKIPNRLRATLRFGKNVVTIHQHQVSRLGF